ncbi:hypothetical protein K443DRAFT_655251 [Laccaria amethystina LaAM-08-1]|uniref:Uncharacterized protein n=1 Tax=Laccaria amethystina LaAM-08-1 TaxID=1095629 RepID=A0A0C9YEE3_9AGAR|nr:hypothetical protein K443DRAFT_655251 [Laccaria amethystina LaAM-08-1]
MTHHPTCGNPYIVRAASTSHYHQCYPPPTPSTSFRHTWYFTLDGVVTFTHLASHLKCSILQPVTTTNPSK